MNDIVLIVEARINDALGQSLGHLRMAAPVLVVFLQFWQRFERTEFDLVLNRFAGFMQLKRLDENSTSKYSCYDAWCMTHEVVVELAVLMPNVPVD
jgi:hypothetical protein